MTNQKAAISTHKCQEELPKLYHIATHRIPTARAQALGYEVQWARVQVSLCHITVLTMSTDVMPWSQDGPSDSTPDATDHLLPSHGESNI